MFHGIKVNVAYECCPHTNWGKREKVTLYNYQGCGAVTFLVGSGSGSGEAFRLRLRLRLRVKLFGGSGSGSGSGQNVPAPTAPAPMIESSHEPKPTIRFSKM